MSDIPFSVKYRPTKLDDVIGQDIVVQSVKNAVQNKTLHHAYIFAGLFGTGKTTMARILAAIENCSNRKGVDPCGECNNCRQIFAGKSLDVKELDAASNRSIDDIRALKDEIRHNPIECKVKYVIIDECLSKHSRVETDIGKIPIGVIVNNKLKPKVKSYNHKTGKIEYKKITGWFKNSGKECFKVAFEGVGKVYCSEGHLFSTPNGYKSLKELSIGDIVHREGKKLTLYESNENTIEVVEEVVTQIESIGYQSITYDLEIEDNNNYFVSGTLVHNCHSLTGQAAEAALKMIEEPPKHVRFILATTEPHKLKDTIHSRCIMFKFNSVSWSILARHLIQVADHEGIKYDSNALKLAARCSQGSVRNALQNLQTLLNYAGDGEITVDYAKNILGTVDENVLYNLMKAITEADAPAALKYVEQLLKDGRAIDDVVNSLNNHLRNLMLSITCKNNMSELGFVEEDIKRLHHQSSNMKLSLILEMISNLADVGKGITFNLDPKILLEKYVIDSIIYYQKKKRKEVDSDSN